MAEQKHSTLEKLINMYEMQGNTGEKEEETKSVLFTSFPRIILPQPPSFLRALSTCLTRKRRKKVLLAPPSSSRVSLKAPDV